MFTLCFNIKQKLGRRRKKDSDTRGNMDTLSITGSLAPSMGGGIGGSKSLGRSASRRAQ